MKERLKNYITSIIGILLMFIALGMFIGNAFHDIGFTYLEMISMILLGYIFLMTKDTLIEGLFLNIFKFKNNNKYKK